ncbi:MAG TPA: metalloregulator ArsR/SmtB family transcription factor [Bryobacteraceae bacterium]|jgi:DNA-binding transcriptional ArsR family regulator|nr:metalloregulator ArsR/SmtB family transcription factor [Bryobacteraceae bacterium]
MPDLDRTFTALAHPARRAVLAQLRKGEAPVKDLTHALGISGPALTKHLRMLEQAGLITRSREAQRRPCRLSTKPLRELDEWMESYRQFWTDSFDKLDEHLKAVQRAKRKGRKR